MVRRLFTSFFAIAAIVYVPVLAHAQMINQDFTAEYIESTVVPGDPGAVSVSLTDHEGVTITPFVDTPVPGLISYVGRPKFDARTGGANAQQDVGPLSFTYTDGGSMTTVDYPIEPLGTAPGPQVLTNVAGAEPALAGDGFIRVGDNVNGLNNNVAWDTAYTGAFDSISAAFQIRLQQGGAANDNADGFGFMYVDQAAHGSSGAVYTTGEEPSGTGLGVGFDIWDNGDEGGNSISLHQNGNLIGSVNVTDANANREAYLESGQPIDVSIVATAGTPSTGNPAQWITQSMNFSTSATRDAPDGGLTPMIDADPTAGIQDAYYRLTDAINNQGNYLTFDAAPGAPSRPGFGARTGGANATHDIDNVAVSFESGKVTASYDFRIAKDGSPADGLSFVLAPTSLYGETGVIDRFSDGEGAGWEVAEDPNLEGAFGLGFKTFEDDAIRVRFDGNDLATLGADALPESFASDTFVDGEWHSATVMLTANGSDADVMVMLDDVAIFSDTVVGAAPLVPEPSSVVLLIAGALGLCGVVRRRRR